MYVPINCIYREGQQPVFGPWDVVCWLTPPLYHIISTAQSWWAYQSLPPVGMPWFGPVSILEHSANFFFLSYLLCVSIVWTITELVFHYPFGPSYTVAKFSPVLWTCPAKSILPPWDPSWPAFEISTDRLCEEASSGTAHSLQSPGSTRINLPSSFPSL